MKSMVLASALMVPVIASAAPDKRIDPTVTEATFGVLEDGGKVSLYTLTNSTGAEVRIINYGAIVVSLKVPDRAGRLRDVVLGYDDLAGYVQDKAFLGAIVGRYANRIAARAIHARRKELPAGSERRVEPPARGRAGFLQEAVEGGEGQRQGRPRSQTHLLTAPTAREGIRERSRLTVTYTLTPENALRIEYQGTTDKPTILNPTHHSYFNLSGDPTQTVLDEELTIDADQTTAVGAGLIPTGKLVDVAGTPMDFRQPAKIGARIEASDEQLVLGKGYDHNWVLRHQGSGVHRAAELFDARSGIVLQVLTDQPGLQFYSGNFLNGTIHGKQGVVYQRRTALCLEAQLFPDAPNHPTFPSPRSGRDTATSRPPSTSSPPDRTAGMFRSRAAGACWTLTVTAGVLAMTSPVRAQTPATVNVSVDATAAGTPLERVWPFHGYDEINYTTTPEGEALLGAIAAAHSAPVHVRSHFLLNTGDGTPALKWGSTNVYTEDAAGNPIYSWDLTDGIMDTITGVGAFPFVEIGFMPEALSTHPTPYRNSSTTTLDGGCFYPPTDYTKWADLISTWAMHANERYPNVAASWLWELWNEPDIGYWNGTFADYAKLYDYTESALHAVLPNARAGRSGGGGRRRQLPAPVPPTLRDRHQRRHRQHRDAPRPRDLPRQGRRRRSSETTSRWTSATSSGFTAPASRRSPPFRNSSRRPSTSPKRIPTAAPPAR